MAKLQLYIHKSLRGYKNLASFNPQPEVRSRIHDYRAAVESVTYDTSKPHTFYLLTYLDEGFILSILTTLAGEEAGDHVAATVFFSAGLKISAPELAALYAVLSTPQVKSGRLSAEILEQLREFFDKDYIIDPEAPHRLPSGGSEYAYSYYGGDNPSLEEYAVARFYQPVFSDYAGVLLIKKSEDGPRGKNPEADLTLRAIKPTTSMRPPAATPEGFRPYIYHRPFVKKLIVPAGEPVKITWKHNGFETVVQTVLTEENKECRPEAADTSQARKTITHTNFYVTEEGSNLGISDFSLKINGKENDTPGSFTYRELVGAKVEITSAGYHPYSATLDLTGTAQAFIQLKKQLHTYRFELPLQAAQGHESVRIYLNTRKPMHGSPVEGYDIAADHLSESKTNHLYYIGVRYRRTLLVGLLAAVAAFILGLLAGMLIFRQDKPAPAPVIIVTDDRAEAPASDIILTPYSSRAATL